MAFPDRPYDEARSYVAGYRDEIVKAWQSVDGAALDKAAHMLETAIRARRTIYACGNGGSAAIANHLLCDFLKGIQTDTAHRPKIVTLAHLELVTAIANDIAFEEVFAYQLRTMAEPGDVLITISSSGNSENIVRAVAWAREHGVGSIAMTGFDGGRSSRLAEINLHVRASNYGVVEDVHQSLMHCLSQHLRQKAMPPELIPQRKF